MQFFVRLALLLVTLSAITERVSASSILQSATFGGPSQPGWSLFGDAFFTGNGSIDASGQGWLRLTRANNEVTGGAFSSTAFSIAYGFDVSFEYKTWGGSGADGFALAFIGGTTNLNNRIGADGGSLGYAQKTGVAGLPGAFLGVGFDEYGNFAAGTEGRNGGPGLVEDAVTLRGPGNGASLGTNRPNYGFLATSGQLASDTFQMSLNDLSARPTGTANYRAARVIADTSQIPNGRLPVTVYLQRGNSGQVQVITYDAYAAVLAYYGSVTNIPSTLRIGFTAANGGLSNRHEVRNLQVNSVLNTPGFPTAVPEPGTNLLIAFGLIGLGFAARAKRKNSK